MLLEQTRTGDALTLRLNGAWTIANVSAIEAALGPVCVEEQRRLIVDCTALEALDLSGAWLLSERIRQARERGARVELAGEPPTQLAFLAALEEQPEATKLEENELSVSDVLA